MPWNPTTPGSTSQGDNQFPASTAPSVTGSRGDGTALANLLAALDTAGWIKNNSSA